MTPVAAPREREAQELRSRAATLARRQPDLLAEGRQPQVVEFSVAGQPCILELAWVREVRRLRGLAPLPLARAPVLGLVHLRGRMLAVLDLAAVIGLPAAAPPAAGDLLVMGREQARFAFAGLVVQGVRDAAPAQPQGRVAGVEPLRPETVRGVTAGGHLLLDGERLLAAHAGRGG